MADKKEDKEETIKFNFHNRLKKLYLKPNEFLKEADKEKSYQKLLRSFILFYLVYLVLMQGIALVSGNIVILQALKGFAYGLMGIIILLFLFTVLLHFFLIIVGQKVTIFNSYKTTIYVLILWVFYSILILIASLIVPFDGQGLQTVLTGAQGYSEVISLIFSFLLANPISLLWLIVSLAVYIHIFVFGVKALKVFQKATTAKAVFGILVTGIALFIAQIVLVTFLISKGIN